MDGSLLRASAHSRDVLPDDASFPVGVAAFGYLAYLPSLGVQLLGSDLLRQLDITKRLQTPNVSNPIVHGCTNGIRIGLNPIFWSKWNVSG